MEKNTNNEDDRNNKKISEIKGLKPEFKEQKEQDEKIDNQKPKNYNKEINDNLDKIEKGNIGEILQSLVKKHEEFSNNILELKNDLSLIDIKLENIKSKVKEEFKEHDDIFFNKIESYKIEHQKNITEILNQTIKDEISENSIKENKKFEEIKETFLISNKNILDSIIKNTKENMAALIDGFYQYADLLLKNQNILFNNHSILETRLKNLKLIIRGEIISEEDPKAKNIDKSKKY